jgi:mxaL protein
MRKIVDYLRHHRDAALLSAALLLLVVALFRPTVPVDRNIYSYMFVVDISQSMNVEDMTLNGKRASRLAYTKQMLRDIVSGMPCGTRVSVALFAGVSVSALYSPIEVCANYAAIQDTIDHLDWRMAWSGNSRVRESMLSVARTLRALPEPAQVVFFTDGEEAPRLHAFNTRDLSNFQGGSGWLLVGVGSGKGTAIPKYDEKNQLIGYWAGDSFAMQPGIAQISEQNIGNRDNNVAAGEGDRYLSKLDEDYLKSLAKEVSGIYVRGDSLQTVRAAMNKQKPARHDVAPFDLHILLASLAGLLLLAAHLPRHPLGMLRHLRLLRRN